MNVNLAKVLALFVLGFGSTFCGLLPAALKKYNFGRKPVLHTVLLCFGAGILLATSIVHMLPEVEHDIPDTAQLVFCCGFLLVYLSDELLHFCCDRNNHEESQPILRQSSTIYGSTSHSHAQTDQETDSEIIAPHETADECTTHSKPVRQTLVAIIGMLTALSIHSFLEGLAIGIQATTARVIILFTAVISHKLVVAFCLGVELSASHDSKFKNHFIAIFVFSAGSVVGIIIGMGLVDLSSVTNSKLLPVLQGVAAGTLLYVTVCEVLPREKARCQQNRNNKFMGILQFSSLSVGFALMTLMNTYISDGD